MHLRFMSSLDFSAGCENDSKSCLAAHHALVGFGGALQRIDFGHSPHTGERTEGQRVLRIN